ncbi:hypothetical protein [Hymenobacter coalescens]
MKIAADYAPAGLGQWLGFLVGALVLVADSPMFSSLVARSTPETTRGTALTIVNCLGFALTVPSIELTSWTVG